MVPVIHVLSLLVFSKLFAGFLVHHLQKRHTSGTIAMQTNLMQCAAYGLSTDKLTPHPFNPIWTFSLRGVLTFVASGSAINGCVWSYFEGTANLHCYTSCILTTLHFVEKCHFFSVVTWKYIIKYLQKCEGCTHFCEILYFWIYFPP